MKNILVSVLLLVGVLIAGHVEKGSRPSLAMVAGMAACFVLAAALVLWSWRGNSPRSDARRVRR